MQQTIISFAPNKVEQQPTLKQRWQECVNSVNLWLNAKSLFYSNICQYSVSRRTVLRVNMVTAAMLVGAVCVEQEPVVAVVAMAVAAWLTAALKRHSNKHSTKKDTNMETTNNNNTHCEAKQEFFNIDILTVRIDLLNDIKRWFILEQAGLDNDDKEAKQMLDYIVSLQFFIDDLCNIRRAVINGKNIVRNNEKGKE